MSDDARARYLSRMQAVGNRFDRERPGLPTMRELPGVRVRAVLPAACFYHLQDFHGVTLSDKDQVDWVCRKNPEVVPETERKIQVGGWGAEETTNRTNLHEGDGNDGPTGASPVGAGTGRGRMTRFGRASFTRCYG